MTTSVLDTLRRSAEAGATGRVFGEPVAQDGVVLLPVAKVGYGYGGGAGSGPSPSGDHGDAEGGGGGFGASGRGLGVFVLDKGQVSWRPAVDVNRAILGGQVLAGVALLIAGVILRERRSGGRSHGLRAAALRSRPGVRARRRMMRRALAAGRRHRS
ncbi:spore germination protein GerW family protein [Actinoplanes sp. RD1]|uniref:spore germination protein GerW family protein n=1 Tax=Actinoplanes sp. RD1 TaxID=3064538 RepID=UPI002740C318|nr:spore germination protein GerW family protein [Actinoplanes sp. RD1]